MGLYTSLIKISFAYPHRRGYVFFISLGFFIEDPYRYDEVIWMEERLNYLVYLMLSQRASDVHFVFQHEELRVQMRGMRGMERLRDARIDERLYHYLKYISNLDLANSNEPQSGRFTHIYDGKRYFFRFSVLTTIQTQTGVLRILNNHSIQRLEQLSVQKSSIAVFQKWICYRTGLLLMCGPTGSGKTTTLHTLLRLISVKQNRKVITLEDPIEIIDGHYLQLQINEKAGFTYEEGIRQLLRHDPDVIMLGEIRDRDTAKMAYRCALTGHLVFSTIHAKDAYEALYRMEELGLSRYELHEVIKGIAAQRLCIRYKRKERTCIYEILAGQELEEFFISGKPSKKHKTIQKEIHDAVEQQLIDAKEAFYDLEDA